MPFEQRSIEFWEIPSIPEKVGSKEGKGQPKLGALNTGGQVGQKRRVQPLSVSTVGPRQWLGPRYWPKPRVQSTVVMSRSWRICPGRGLHSDFITKPTPGEAKLWEVGSQWGPWRKREALISALKLDARWFLSVYFLQRRICSFSQILKVVP